MTASITIALSPGEPAAFPLEPGARYALTSDVPTQAAIVPSGFEIDVRTIGLRRAAAEPLYLRGRNIDDELVVVSEVAGTATLMRRESPEARS